MDACPVRNELRGLRPVVVVVEEEEESEKSLRVSSGYHGPDGTGGGYTTSRRS